MSGLATLMKYAQRRVEEALTAWQILRAQCDTAKQKLRLLKQHGEVYHGLMRADLQQGTSASSTMAHIGFVRQIEAVTARQEGELGSLEAACARLWLELLEARRQKRMYQILSERAQLRDANTATRRNQAEIDELLQRATRMP